MAKVREFDFEYFIGPAHPGVTGNMSYHVWAEGDTIIKIEPNLGYLHRGFEKLVEQRHWIKNFPLILRICVPEPDVNEVLLSMAIEELNEIDVPERAQYIRIIVLELARLAAYLFYFGGVAGTIGLYTIPQWTIGDRDYILDLFEELTGGRVYHIYQTIGGVRRDLPEGFEERVLKTLDYLEERLKDYDKLFFEHPLFEKRTKGIGIVDKDTALRFSVTGPNLRAAGVNYDVRKQEPYLIYDRFEFDVPDIYKDGDVYSRVMQRRLEFAESIKIIRQAVRDIPRGPVNIKIRNPFEYRVKAGSTYVKLESSKGEYGFYVVSDGGVLPYRLHVRGPSFSHGLQLVRHIAEGINIADISMTLFSLDVCPPDAER